MSVKTFHSMANPGQADSSWLCLYEIGESSSEKNWMHIAHRSLLLLLLVYLADPSSSNNRGISKTAEAESKTRDFLFLCCLVACFVFCFSFAIAR
jgi:hypothetical protein